MGAGGGRLMTIKTRECAIRDTILEALEGCEEPFEVLGPQGIDAWTISWREVVVRGYYKENGEFAWSAVNSRTGASTGGDVSDDPDDVIDRIEQVIVDPMQAAWVGTINECLARNERTMIVSEDRLTVRAYNPASAVSRLATYGRVPLGKGRIGLLWRPEEAQWVPHDEYLPKNEDAVREMAVRAYEWVRAIND